MPTVKAEVTNVAFLVVVFTAPVPRVIEPSLKVTVPLTAPPDTGVIAAVNVTVCPWLDWLSDEARVVAVLALLTICFRPAEVPPFRLLSPL